MVVAQSCLSTLLLIQLVTAVQLKACTWEVYSTPECQIDTKDNTIWDLHVGGEDSLGQHIPLVDVEGKSVDPNNIPKSYIPFASRCQSTVTPKNLKGFGYTSFKLTNDSCLANGEDKYEVMAVPTANQACQGDSFNITADRVHAIKDKVGACFGRAEDMKWFYGIQLVYKPIRTPPKTSQSTVSITSTSTATTRSAPTGSYTVRAGDTGWALANANGIAVADLMAANPGTNWDLLPIGSTLVVPSKKQAV
ncbi:uncharacterized protein AB675_8482 [Cyphellophora attinorum]|uniref:LysM domain-containing protein n=1 Tax=Cyphellophora attinorum TaxID=1664694 RepID=A0A0N0NR80_9EURO|nr:uncharacterized protein AB675_8482 [Phialophora attinorum]KPI44519.1 hypothetical protein AB675_8482 [Phialophora attinorum]